MFTGRLGLANGNQFLGRGERREIFPAATEEGAASAHREYFQRVWDCRAGGAKRLFREQVCSAWIYGGAAARIGRDLHVRFVRASRRGSPARLGTGNPLAR